MEASSGLAQNTAEGRRPPAVFLRLLIMSSIHRALEVSPDHTPTLYNYGSLLQASQIRKIPEYVPLSLYIRHLFYAFYARHSISTLTFHTSQPSIAYNVDQIMVCSKMNVAAACTHIPCISSLLFIPGLLLRPKPTCSEASSSGNYLISKTRPQEP